MSEKNKGTIKSELEVHSYLQNLRYALEHGAKINFQEKRFTDRERDVHFTNRYTMETIFPNESPVHVLQRELRSLTVANYMRTVQDCRFPNRAPMWEFGKVYRSTQEVYIKIRVELLNEIGSHTTFVMSFHFAEKAFNDEMFPYKDSREVFS